MGCQRGIVQIKHRLRQASICQQSHFNGQRNRLRQHRPTQRAKNRAADGWPFVPCGDGCADWGGHRGSVGVRHGKGDGVAGVAGQGDAHGRPRHEVIVARHRRRKAHFIGIGRDEGRAIAGVQRQSHGGICADFEGVEGVEAVGHGREAHPISIVNGMEGTTATAPAPHVKQGGCAGAIVWCRRIGVDGATGGGGGGVVATGVGVGVPLTGCATGVLVGDGVGVGSGGLPLSTHTSKPQLYRSPVVANLPSFSLPLSVI